jgi:hypothetical protein
MDSGKRRFSDSSIEVSAYSKLFDETLTSSSEICLWDHPAIAHIKASQLPRYRVFLTRLEPKIRVYSDEKLTHTVAYSREVAECIIADGVAEAGKTLAEGFLFDATSVGRLMCLGVGRYPHNMLRPFVGDDVERYYADPDTLDPACICGQISRDHGLVFLDAEGKIKYRDFGTKKSGSRAGSKNGTWVNGEHRVHNTVCDWRPEDYLGLGGRVWVQREGQLVKEHVFKLRYEKLEAPPLLG